MSLPQTITTTKKLNEKKPRILQRNGSQLLQHATSKFGLRRSSTTSRAQQQQQQPQQIQPRPSTSSVLFSTHTNLTNSSKSRRNVKDIPQPSNFTSDSVTNQILSSYNSTTTTPPLTFTNNSKMSALYQDNNNNRLLSAIPENKQQGIFKMSLPSSSPGYYRAFLSSIAYEMKRRIITSDRIKHDIEYNNVFDGKEAVVSKVWHV